MSGAVPTPVSSTALQRQEPNTVEIADRQIISQASLSVEVEDVAGAVAQVRTIAETRGGFISQVATTGTPGRQRSDLVVRVPQGEFFDTLESIKGLGKVWAENAGSEDVTEQFIDLEARLRSALREEQSLLSLLERADTVSNILTIERELARVRSDIERLQGQINYLSRRVDLATISVALFPPEERLAEPPYGSLNMEVEDVSASVDEVKALVARVGGELEGVFLSVSNGREQAGIEFSVLAEDFSSVLSQVEGQGEVTYKEIRESTGNVVSEEPDSRLTVFLMEGESSLGRWLLIGGAAIVGGVLLLLLLYAVYRAVRSRPLRPVSGAGAAYSQTDLSSAALAVLGPVKLPCKRQVSQVLPYVFQGVEHRPAPRCRPPTVFKGLVQVRRGSFAQHPVGSLAGFAQHLFQVRRVHTAGRELCLTAAVHVDAADQLVDVKGFRTRHVGRQDIGGVCIFAERLPGQLFRAHVPYFFLELVSEVV